ncbi:Peroxiredoxin-5, mitochondrial [Candida viswanathii]|uniref:Peroxiredoxin-5, mitochondrial n=1 Tax=Candida viswanathii TaxID=5486 RepID=A0A367Y4J8_9ASCO|nr:Peroxiredoxin-5, mitochondrial [Candida viswanathii]
MFSLARSIPRAPLAHSVLRNSWRSYVAVGDKIPSTTVYEGSPGNEVDLAKETASGKSIIIGVPGAFSPGCSKSHVPGYIKNVRAFNDKGYQKFFVVAVNDAFVTKAWGDQLLESIAGAQIRFIADPAGAFTKDLDLLFDASKFFGNERSKRYALIVEDGEIKKTFVEPDNTSVEVSAAPKVLEEA